MEVYEAQMYLRQTKEQKNERAKLPEPRVSTFTQVWVIIEN